MIGLFLYLMSFHGLVFGTWQTEGFKKTSIANYDILQTTKMTKTLIECCSFCMAKHCCHGVTFDGKDTCTLLTNVITSNDGPSEAWIMQRIISTKNRFGSKVLVASGSNSDKTTEIIDLEDASFRCNVDPYPTSASTATGGLVCYTPIICGGISGSFQKSCYSLNEDGSWKDEADLNEAKMSASTGSVTIDNKMVIAGGHNGGDLKTIEVVAPNTQSEILPIKLPVAHHGLCIVSWDTNTFMVIGGSGGRTRTFLIHTANNSYTEGPNLQIGHHWTGCNTITVNGQDYIIVAGGSGAAGSTEYISKANYASGWKRSVDLPVDVDMHQMVASKDKTSLYTIGNGKSSNNKDIYKFECTQSITECSWTKIPTQLQSGRKQTVAMPIPNELANKLCNYPEPGSGSGSGPGSGSR